MRECCRQSSRLRWVLLLTGFAFAAPGAATAQAPVVRAFVPDSAAAGAGQMIVIQGSNLSPATVTFTPKEWGTPCSDFIVSGTSTEVYVRLTNALSTPICTVAPGKYRVTVSTPVGASNEAGFVIKEKPAAPKPRSLCALTIPLLACSPLTSAGVGAGIGVLSYGVDVPPSTATAVFSQGSTVIEVSPLYTITTIGIVHAFVVPSGLVSGTALIQMRTTVAGVSSDNSFALKLTIPQPGPTGRKGWPGASARAAAERLRSSAGTSAPRRRRYRFVRVPDTVTTLTIANPEVLEFRQEMNDTGVPPSAYIRVGWLTLKTS